MVRKAVCCCGTCSIEVDGEPVLNCLCHCADCKRRTGSAFGWSAYFRDDQIVATKGRFSRRRVRDEQVRSFCSACGTTLFWTWRFFPDQTGLAAGAFTEAPLPEPTVSVSSQNCVGWFEMPAHWKRVQR
jgi:hypothetical protein